MDKLVAAIISFLVALPVALFVPWTKWAVEKRRARLERRRELVNDWRAMIRELHVQRTLKGGPSQTLGDFLPTLSWTSLKPHLSSEGWEFIKQCWNSYNYDKVIARLIDEVGDIERKWDLV